MRIPFIVLLALSVLLFLGGIGDGWNGVVIFGVLVFAVLLLITYIYKGNLHLPYGFNYYSIFLICVLLNLFWSSNFVTSFGYFIFFVSAGLVWIISYNLEDELEIGFKFLLISLSVLFSLFFLFHLFLGTFYIVPFSLYLPVNGAGTHDNLGSLWALALVAIFSDLAFQKNKKKSLPILVLYLVGFLLIVISGSRSALIALAIGIMFMLIKKNKGERRNWLVVVSLFAILFSFFVASFFKTTLASRFYFLQGIVGLFIKPFGVGLGNFGQISNIVSDKFSFLEGTTDYAHNLVIEMISGLGILSISFIFWLYRVSLEIYKKDKFGNWTAAVFFAILTNFMFDFTYFIPTMIWIFFIFLGFAQRSLKR